MSRKNLPKIVPNFMPTIDHNTTKHQATIISHGWCKEGPNKRTTIMLGTSPSIMLSKLTPMKSILCLVRTPTAFGCALSDPYLGHGSPLYEVACQAQVDEIIQDHGVGALLFALPMRRLVVNDDGALALDTLKRQRDSMVQLDWNKAPLLLACVSDQPQWTLQQARLATRQEVEMWEDVDLDAPCSSTDAAVALNQFLWTHTGGWQNTFG